jgi:glucose-6-phosphate isomerase
VARPVLQKNNIPDIRGLLRDEPERTSEMVVETACWRLDTSRTPVPLTAWREFFAASARADFTQAVAELFAGSIVNPSENQPALHMALRAASPAEMLATGDASMVAESRQRLVETAGRLYRGETPIRTILHTGIGGSDLGPRLVTRALDPGDSAVEVEWLTTLDARRIRRLLDRLDPATTALVVASKSFSTVETLTQAASIRDWLGAGGGQRIWAATARPERAVEFGIPDEHVLTFPAWTGGRFSLWSSVGLSAAARIGTEKWIDLLTGARHADALVRDDVARSPAYALARTLDVLIRECGLDTLGVVAYEPKLRLLAEYLQQLIMESLGKSVDIDGISVRQPTSPLVFGGAGTDLQHSLFQALHQGTKRHPMLLLGSAEAGEAPEGWQREQLSHLLGQASALVNGRRADESARELPGNNPVMLMLTGALDGESMGELLAIFEHAVYLLAVRWRINAFDQWGVEEGKRLATAFRAALEQNGASPDAALSDTMEWIKAQLHGPNSKTG